MVSKNDLKVIEIYELFGEMRYRVCVKGTNIVVNVGAVSEDEALDKVIDILAQAGLDEESLNKLRRIIGDQALCKA